MVHVVDRAENGYATLGQQRQPQVESQQNQCAEPVRNGKKHAPANARDECPKRRHQDDDTPQRAEKQPTHVLHAAAKPGSLAHRAKQHNRCQDEKEQ